MKNYFLFQLNNKVIIDVKGNNIERFIKRLKNNNIELLKINYKNKEQIELKIYKRDYEKVINLKTIYEINIKDYSGFIKTKMNIKDNKYIILFIIISLIFIYLLTSLIFSIDIITNDTNMSNNLLLDLKEYGIDKYKFKKNYNEIQIIKEKIKDKYKDKIEWIEIEEKGTKYIVRYEPRIINNTDSKNEFRHIIAKNDAIITSMSIQNGQIIKNINSYVKKGDIIVSGYIYLNDTIKDTVSSVGTVYGKVWYMVNIIYPFKYYEEYETGNKKKNFVINFLNKDIEIFNFNKFKNKSIKDIVLLKNNLLPINLSLRTNKEIKIIDENNDIESATEKAINYSSKKLEKNLKENEYISNYKVIKKNINKENIELSIFFEIVEDITDYYNIEEYEEIIE